MRCLICLRAAYRGGAVLLRCILLLLCYSILVACAHTPTAQQWVLSQSHLQQARSALLVRQWQLALVELRAANRISQRHNPLYWTYMAHAEMGLGQPAVAVSAARHAWQLLPNAAVTLNNYAIALCQRAAQLSVRHKVCSLRQPDVHPNAPTSGHANASASGDPYQSVSRHVKGLRAQRCSMLVKLSTAAAIRMQRAHLLWLKAGQLAGLSAAMRSTLGANWRHCQRQLGLELG